MATHERQIAWVSADGAVVCGGQQELKLALPPAAKIVSANVSDDAEVLVCLIRIHGARDWGAGERFVMAYSLRSGDAVWRRECGPGDNILGVAGDYVWVLHRAESRAVALEIASGSVAASLSLGKHDSCTLVTHGTWRNCLLHQNRAQIVLYAPLAAERIWTIEPRLESSYECLCVARGDWFIRCPCLIDSVVYHLHRLSDGARIPSVLDTPAGRPPLAGGPWGVPVWPTDVLALWGPDRMLIVDENRPGYEGQFVLVDGVFDSNRTASYQRVRHDRKYLIKPSWSDPTPSFEAVVFPDAEHIKFIDSKTAALVSLLPTPGIAGAWRRTLLQCSVRECWAVDNAVAAVDAVVDAADAHSEAVGLVRAVLVGFAAEDARLTSLRLRLRQ